MKKQNKKEIKEEIKEEKRFIFLSKNAFDSVFIDLNTKKTPKLPFGMIISIIITLSITILTAKEFNPNLGIPADTIELILKIIFVLFFIIFIALCIIKFYFLKVKKTKTISPEMVKYELEKKAEELSKYTILLIIPDFRKKDISFLAKKESQWQEAIFLPYIRYNSKLEFDNFKNNLSDKLHESLHTNVNFIWNYLPSMDIYDEIKYHKDESLNSHNYKFVLVYPKSNFLITIFIEELKRHLEYSSYSIEDMENDFNSRDRNLEVINKLKENKKNLKNQIDNLQRKTNRLLWNISEQCGLKCEFCAFGEVQEEVPLQTSEIKQIIENLKKIRVDTIDISTGNKVRLPYLKNCISELKKENYNISLTATSDIINQLDDNFILDNIAQIEFSYDSTREANHRSRDFNTANYSCIKNLTKRLKKIKSIKLKFKALIIIYSHLTFKIFEDIIKNLEKIGVKDMVLIRLMPVGFMEGKPYPDKLKQKKTYDDYLKYCEKDNKVVPHCSFDGTRKNIQRYNQHCNKGITKISMNPRGDIYSCPWGEHLSTGSGTFRLGNMINDDIVEILNKQDFANMNDKKFTCKIFEIKEGEDPLYKDNLD